MPVGKKPRDARNPEQTMKVSADIRALIERRKEGHSLDAPFYTSEDIFALDMEAIFRQHWIQVAIEPDIPEPGDYVTVQLGNDSILIARVPQRVPSPRRAPVQRR